MINEVIEDVESSMNATIEAIRRDLSRLRTALAKVQDLTNSNTNALDQLGKQKEQEILTV
jgi:ribosome recycling factor